MPNDKRCLIVIACMVLAAHLTGCGRSVSTTDYRPYLVANPDKQFAAESANDRTQRKMAVTLHGEFDSHRIVNAIDYLRREIGANVFVNWATFEAAGVEKSLPRTFHIPPGSADVVLRALLKAAADEAEHEPIDFAIIEGVIHIASVKELERKSEQLRVYDIRGLFPFTPPPPDPTKKYNPPAWEQRLDHIVKTLQAKPHALAWFERWDHARIFGEGELVVRATQKQHAQLQAALHRMRHAGSEDNDHSVKIDTRTVITRDYRVAQPTRPLLMSQADAKAKRALARVISVNWEANKVVNVLEDLSRRSGLAIKPHWDELEAVGIEQDLPITIKLDNLPAGTVLQLLLEQAGAGAELAPIGYTLIDGVVHVSSLHEMDKYASRVREHDVRDLLQPEVSMANGSRVSPYAEREEQLAELGAFVRRDHDWQGEHYGLIQIIHGTALIIDTTAAEHETMAQLFDALRASRKRAATRTKR